MLPFLFHNINPVSCIHSLTGGAENQNVRANVALRTNKKEAKPPEHLLYVLYVRQQNTLWTLRVCV